MKRMLVSVLSFVLMLLTLCSCGFDANKPSKEVGASTQNSKTESKEEIFSLNETAVFSDLKFTATEIKESNGETWFAPETGNVFVGVNFTIENISSEEQDISSILLFEVYADDVKCDYSFTAAAAFGDTLDGSIAPGKKMVGWYAVEVPKEWKNMEVHVSSDWLSNNPAKFLFTK